MHTWKENICCLAKTLIKFPHHQNVCKNIARKISLPITRAVLMQFNFSAQRNFKFLAIHVNILCRCEMFRKFHINCWYFFCIDFHVCEATNQCIQLYDIKFVNPILHWRSLSGFKINKLLGHLIQHASQAKVCRQKYWIYFEMSHIKFARPLDLSFKTI